MGGHTSETVCGIGLISRIFLRVAAYNLAASLGLCRSRWLFAGMFVTRGFLKAPSARRYFAQKPSRRTGTIPCGEHTGSLSFSPSNKAASLYSEHCAVCHNSVNNTGAPREDVLRRLTPERILAALETGSMMTQGSSMTATERQAIAKWLGRGRIELTAAVLASRNVSWN